MTSGNTPGWLRFLERRIGWIAIPQLGILLITLQALGFLFILNDPLWFGRLALVPEAFWAGEYFRALTFLALPVSESPVWLFFGLWFLYFITNALESEWGSFRTTFYVLFAWLVTVVFSVATGFPILQVRHFESMLFLAAAALFPDFEVRLFFAIPVKLKFLGLLSAAFVLWEFLTGSWLERAYLVAIFSSFLLFFGPAALGSARQAARRWNYRRKLRG